jgi:hypothetical protein
MNQQKKPSPKTQEVNGYNQIGAATIGCIGAIVVAVLGMVGVALNAYLSSQAVRAPIQIAIQATQTAEAKLALSAPAVTSSTDTVSILHSTFTPSPTLMPPLIIADFDHCLPRNELGGTIGVTFNSPDSMSAEYFPEPGGGCSAKLVYHIEKYFVTFYLNLMGTHLTNYNTCSFDIRGDSAIGIPVEVKVELKRSNNAEMAYYYISEVTEDWQTICLPFAHFQPISLPSYSEMSELVFTFELNRTGLDGAVYLDNIVARIR